MFVYNVRGRLPIRTLPPTPLFTALTGDTNVFRGSQNTNFLFRISQTAVASSHKVDLKGDLVFDKKGRKGFSEERRVDKKPSVKRAVGLSWLLTAPPADSISTRYSESLVLPLFGSLSSVPLHLVLTFFSVSGLHQTFYFITDPLDLLTVSTIHWYECLSEEFRSSVTSPAFEAHIALVSGLHKTFYFVTDPLNLLTVSGALRTSGLR
ncbi:hypothetical protein J6590_050794 [Homalodisca vitripennis]|nr:hypothetical protein J6590_050794 [Homalodisca vitripennis]